MSKFINNGDPIKIRIGKSPKCYWKTLRKSEIIDLDIDSKYGKNLKLTPLKTTEGKLGDQVVETKQVEYTNDSVFYNELISINGIGPKTAEDIVDFATKEKLIEVVKLKGALPFRDDVEKILRRKYGK